MGVRDTDGAIQQGGHRNRGQSEVIGTVVLIGIVVATTTALGGVVLAQFTGTAAPDEPLLAFEYEVNATNVTLIHGGGRTVGTDETVVILRGPDGETRYDVTESTIDGDGDDRFEPGERATMIHGFSAGETIEIVVVDEGSNSVVFHGTERIPAADGTTT